MFAETTILVMSGRTNDPETIARMLADEYRVIETETAEDALGQLSNGADVVVVADLESAKSKGLELLRRLKLRLPSTPFLAVANDGDVNAAVEAMKLGAADCLVKPIKRDELHAIVSRLIGQSRTPAPPGSNSGGVASAKQGSHIDIPPGTSLEDLERAAVEQALTQHQGNRTHAAKTLGISVRTLQRKLKAWGMPMVPLQNSSSSGNNFVLPTHSGNSSYSAHAH